MNTSVSLPIHRQAMVQTLAVAAALFSCFFVIIVSRRADIIFNAQPWAEDGTVWLAQAYNEGIWRSLFRPQDGYFQTISRIAYGTGLIFGLENAPAVATSVAIAVRCEEALAIVIHSVTRTKSLREALVVAANHDGESSTTAAMTGNLAGALYSASDIPNRWVSKLAMHDKVTEIAVELASLDIKSDCQTMS